MDKHLNFFVPYQNSPAWYENQLTRALLVVLRYSPMAHQTWFALIEADQQLSDLPKAEFETQCQRVIGDHLEISDGEVVRGISVWLAPNAEQVTTSVQKSDRQQVLDGVITYGSDLVVVIENKIVDIGATEQPSRINLHGAPVEFDKVPRSVTWQKLLGALSDLVSRELVFGAERLLLTDFFEFVEEHFPNIGPYSTLERCGSQIFRLERRLDAIQGKVVGTSEGKGIGWRDITGTDKIAMARLAYDSESASVCLQMYPADTLGQARAFYGDVSAVKSLLAMRSHGWSVNPNFHWGFTATGYAWMKSPLPVDDYCDYWIRKIGATKEIKRAEWETYWASLESDRIVEGAAKMEFDAEFTASRRQKAHVRPGLACEFRWPLAEARQLEAKNKLIESVRARVNQLLIALNAPQISAEIAPADDRG